MELLNFHEGFNLETHWATINPNEVKYSIPVHAGRVRRVLIRRKGHDRYVALHRNEQLRGYDDKNMEINSHVLPQFKLEGNHIVLSRPYLETNTNGLQIEMEDASELFDNDDSTLPASWPLQTESLLILDTVCAALGVEEGLDAERTHASDFWQRRRRMENVWYEYIEERTDASTFVEPYSQGA
jgi:hypothetical protein